MPLVESAPGPLYRGKNMDAPYEFTCIFASFRLFNCHSRRLNPLNSIATVFALALLVPGTFAAGQSKTATATTLTLTSDGEVVSSVASGSVVTLTAAVISGSTNITAGELNFCDANAKYCTDIHLLGTSQMTSAGTASLKFRPGIGSHSYKAVFLATNNFAASSSGISPLSVTGLYPTFATIQQSGNPGNYSLTANVQGVAPSTSLPAPAGNVSFIDTTNASTVLATAPVGSGTTSIMFLNSSNPATVPEPNVVAAADFNDDGIQDLAVSASNTGETALTILLGNGDGTFTAAATNPTVGHYPDSIAVGDFNGDGTPDLAVSSVDDDIVTILLGNGDGTFTAGPTLNTVSTPQSVAVGDFNGDGIADLAVVNATSVLIFLGNGDGTFTLAPSSTDLGASAITVAVGDFNGDGIEDLAVTNGTTTGLVTILLGNGDGTFRAGTGPLAAGASAVGITVADLNNDGIPDLAVTDYEHSGVNVFLGKGDGTFQPAVFYSAPYLNARSVVAADFNGDGVPDLAVGHFWFYGPSILLGNGDGTFQTAIEPEANTPLASGYIAAADLNGDGIPDMVVPNQDVSGTAVIELVQPSQTVTASTNNISPIGPGPHLIVAQYAGDSDYGASISGATSLTSIAATPSITWPAPAAITYGTALSSTQLDATASVPGTFVYLPAAGTVLGAGPQTLSVAFTPIDTTDYASATATVALTVDPAILTVTANNAGRPYDTEQTTAQDGSQSVLGPFNYDDFNYPDGTLLNGQVMPTGPTWRIAGGGNVTVRGNVLTDPNDLVSYSSYLNQTSTGDYNCSSGDMAGCATTGAATFVVAPPPPGAYPYDCEITSATLIAQNSDLVVDGALHTIISPCGWQFSIRVGGPMHTIDAGGFPAGLMQLNGSATYQIGYQISVPNQSVILNLPDGEIRYYQGNNSSAPACVIGSRAQPWGCYNSALASYLCPTCAVHPSAWTLEEWPKPGSAIVEWKSIASGGSANPTLTYSIAGFVNGDTESVVSGSASLATTATTSSTVGSFPITVAQGTLSASNYTFNFVNGTLAIYQATPTINWAAPAAITYGTALSATQLDASSTVAGTFAYTPATGTVPTGGSNTLLVTLTPTDAADYAAASETVSLTVSQASQTITFAALPAVTYGVAPITVGASASSGLPVSFASTTASVCTVSGSTVTLVVAGTCTVRATQNGNIDYSAAPAVTQSIAVNKATQAITFPAIPATPLLTGSVSLNANASSGLPVGFASTTSSVCTVTGSTATLIATGTCTIKATQVGNGGFLAAAQVEQSFAVNQNSQSITFAAIAAQTVGTSLKLSATATSGLQVSFTSTTAGICVISHTTAMFIASGRCIIDANQTGNSDYSAATQIQQSFTVNGEAQTITFANPGTQTVGTPLALSATATSDLPVSFIPTTTGICTVSRNTARFIVAGTCTIDANQAGNSAYAAAAMVPQSFSVNPEPTFTGSGGGGTISISPGATTGNTVAISVTPSNGFTGAVNLSCSISPISASDPPTCNFAPSLVTITGNTAQSSTLTINTTAATNSASQTKQVFWPTSGGAALALILLLGVPRRRRNWISMLGLLVLIVSFGAVGCGGGGGSSSGGGNNGTTPGTYTVTVTGSSGSQAVTLGTVTLTVQ